MVNQKRMNVTEKERRKVMNHVELSGLIAEPVVAHKVNEQIVHAEFQLQTRHKNRAGEWQKERTERNTDCAGNSRFDGDCFLRFRRR